MSANAQTASAVQSAHALIQRHGIRAAAMAEQQVAEASARNDREAAALWANTVRAINELRREARDHADV